MEKLKRESVELKKALEVLRGRSRFLPPNHKATAEANKAPTGKWQDGNGIINM